MGLIETIGVWGSFLSGVVLLMVSILGAIAFIRRTLHHRQPPSQLLSVAIVIGFLAAGLNTLYWQVFGQIGVNQGWITVAALRLVGSYMDMLFKTAASVAVYLHLAAWHMSLPPEEQKEWSVFGMVFYPRGNGMLARLFNSFLRHNGGKK